MLEWDRVVIEKGEIWQILWCEGIDNVTLPLNVSLDLGLGVSARENSAMMDIRRLLIVM